MEEKKGIQISLSTLVLVVIILILMVSMFVMFNSNQELKTELLSKTEEISQPAISNTVLQDEIETSETEKSPITNTFSEDGVTATEKDKVSISDQSALTYTATHGSITLFYGYIENGKLFYSVDNKALETEDHSRENIKEYTGLSNIKRIKLFHLATDISPRSPFLITDDGKVYNLDIYGNEFKHSLCEDLINYEVDDIINIELANDDSGSYECKLKLKDGTTKTTNIRF